jgi:hypothetical protein
VNRLPQTRSRQANYRCPERTPPLAGGDAFCVAGLLGFCVCVARCWAAMARFAAQVRKRDPQATESNGEDAPLTQAAFSLRQSASAGCPAPETERITRPRATIKTFRKFNSCLRISDALVTSISAIMRLFYIGADEPRLNKFQAAIFFAPGPCARNAYLDYARLVLQTEDKLGTFTTPRAPRRNRFTLASGFAAA